MRDRRGIRARRRRGAGGFSLIELMVVIVMISILAVLAMPSMKTARDDRMAFDYARQVQSIIHRAGTRAMARGAAHLVIIDTNGTRGRAALFEAVDATPAAQFGPKPVSSCRGQRDAAGTFVDHWAEAEAWSPGGAAMVLSPLVELVNMNNPGIERDMNLFARLSEGPAATAAVTIAICYTPGGVVYVGTGSDATNAVTAMRGASPYNSFFAVEIARHDTANAVVGLRRRVIVAGGASPRLVSQ